MHRNDYTVVLICHPIWSQLYFKGIVSGYKGHMLLFLSTFEINHIHDVMCASVAGCMASSRQAQNEGQMSKGEATDSLYLLVS